MALTESIHGYYDERLAEMDSDTICSINLEGDRDYVKRTLPGTVIIFLLLVIAGLMSDVSTQSPLFYYLVTFLSLITIAVHIHLYRSVHHQSPVTIKQWEIYFSITASSIATIWALFSGWNLVRHGINDITLIFLLFSVGIASGAAASNFIWKRVALLFLSITLVPPVIILIIMHESNLAWGLSASFAVYFLFLYLQIIRSNNEYWKALINNKQLEVQAKELLKADKVKSDFFSSMSHELRTPLTAIIGFGQLLEMDDKDEMTTSYAEKITKAGDHLLNLINDILDLSAIAAGKLSLSTKDIPLIDIFTECFSLITPLADRRDIRIIKPSSQSAAWCVKADHIRLKQVLLNLLSNAVKYNSEEGSITINCEKTSNNKIRISITDTGMGMSDSQIQQLFQEFNRLGAEKTSVQGTGIGLVITKRLVELMKGRIGVESQQGKGTTFWIELHQSENPVPTLLKQDKILPDSNQQNITKTPGKKILYMEDNPANLLLVTQIIEQHSPYDIISAPDGRLGVDLAITQKPQLILLDINLPHGDGYAVLKRLREINETKNIPIVAVSANAMQSDIAKAKAAGFTNYVTKPINFQVFLDTISTTLH